MIQETGSAYRLKAKEYDVHLEGHFNNSAITSIEFWVNNLSVKATQKNFGKISQYKMLANNNIFGKYVTINYKLTGNTTRTNSDGSDGTSFYIPKPIDLMMDDFVGLDIGGSGGIQPVYNCDWSFKNSAFLSSGKLIKWDADTLNTKGVFIFIEYDPTDETNAPLVAQGFNKRISNAIWIEDDGDYNLDAELFEDIPLNAKVELRMGRGNFNYLTDNNGKISNIQVYALSYIYGSFQYKAM